MKVTSVRFMRAATLGLLVGASMVPAIMGSGSAAMASNLAPVAPSNISFAPSSGLRIGGERDSRTPNMTARAPVGSSVAARCVRYGERCDYTACCSEYACILDPAKDIHVCVTPRETSPRGVR